MASLDDVVFAFDFSRIETILGVRYLFDYSKNGFHFAFPGGAADPTPQLDGSLLFSGAQYLSLPAATLARFYAAVPTGALTILVQFAQGDASNGALLSFNNGGGGGVWKGLLLSSSMAVGSYNLYAFQGAAGLPYTTALYGTTAVGALHVLGITNEASPRAMRNQSRIVASWGAGAFGTIVNDTTIVPRIGDGVPLGGYNFVGRISHLALLRGALASSDLALYSRLIAEGGRPFCWRQT